MPERPPILARGVIRAEHLRDRLYEVEMPNGHRAYAVIPKAGPRLPEGGEALSKEVTVAFSPFDMSQCQVVGWHTDSQAAIINAAPK